jgi:hypothetical protein
MKDYLLSLFIFVLIFMIMITGCSNDKSNASGNSVYDLSNDGTSETGGSIGAEKDINIDKLEIYHFHGTNQCYSCITVGNYAEETVNIYFAEELESGKIVFDHLNGDLPHNRDLVIKYGATGSSIWLGTYKGDEFKAEENVNVWYKIRDKQGYMNYLKEVIEEKLAGN